MGVAAADVPAALGRFEAAMKAVVSRMDGVVGPGGSPANATDLYAVLEVAALAHGEWVRIHPFANGNGRTARLWVNWVAVRYGLPFFLALKPPPTALIYAAAARKYVDAWRSSTNACCPPDAPQPARRAVASTGRERPAPPERRVGRACRHGGGGADRCAPLPVDIVGRLGRRPPSMGHAGPRGLSAMSAAGAALDHLSRGPDGGGPGEHAL